MNYEAICMQCRFGAAMDGDQSPRRKCPVIIGQERAYRVHCDAGHVFLLVLENGSHALLFDRAIERLAAGETRDAVTDGCTALEMFLSEVPVRARYQSEPGGQLSTIRDEIARVVNTSDRALAGSFAVACLLGRCAPTGIKELEKVRAIRNKAIHAGVRPSEEQGQDALMRIQQTVAWFGEILRGALPARDVSYARAGMLDELHCARALHADYRFVTAQATLTVLDGLGESLPTSVEDRLGEIRSGTEYRQWSAVTLQRPDWGAYESAEEREASLSQYRGDDEEEAEEQE
ncbi:MAG TPA: hypothetical protein VK540_13980 [Polyangiaceae bacterium]|nr:hypothetical protein [Polyangiaceae bacterium]